MRLIPILLLSLFISVPSSYAYNKVYNYETGVGDFVGIENASKDISISCSDGQILKKTGGVWACSSDDSVAGGGTVRVSEDGTFIASADTLNFTTGVKATVATGSKLNVSSDIATTTTPGIASFDSSQFSVGSFGGVSITGINKSLISHNLAASVDVLVSASHDAVTVTGENYASLSGQQITFGTVNDTNLTAEDFGDFTCDSGEDGCLVDSNAVALGTDTTGGYAASTTEGGGATSLEADGVDALTEIAQSIKSAADDTSKLVVGTPGSTDDCAKWDANGALVSAGAACGSGGGGDSISIDGAGVTDPDFVSTGQIDFVDTSNTVTANINDNSILEADLKAVDSATDEDILTYESTTGDFEWHTTDQIIALMSAGGLPNDSILEADLKAVDSASDEECLTYETTTGDFEWQACGSGSDTNAVKEYWWPASATLPLEAADSIPPISKDAGTNVDQLAVLFDDSTDECRTVSFKVPSDIDTSATVTFRVHWYSSSATTGSAYWDFRHNSGVADGADPDAALTTEADGGDTVAGTAGQISAATWTETITNLGWAANDQVDAVFCRDANNGSDNFSGDAYVTGFGVEIPRA